MVDIDINYTGELHCTANHLPSGVMVETDAPVDNQGKGESFSPTDLCASSLGVCMLTILGIVAQNNGIDLAEAKGRVTKEMSEDLPRRISKIFITIELPLSSNHPKKELANKETKFECKILNVKKFKENKIDDNFAKTMGAKDLKDLKDPEKDSERAKNPEWLVMVGVCTHLGCVPLGDKGDYKGWFCPCHGSHYDSSGRIRKGPAPTNLEIPKYEFVNSTTIKIG